MEAGEKKERGEVKGKCCWKFSLKTLDWHDVECLFK